MAALEAAISKLDQIIISLGGSVDSSADALAAAAQAPPAAPPPAPGAPAVPAPPAPVPVATAAAAAVAGKAAPGAREVLTNKVMIKVARVASVERQPNSEKLLKLKIELGADETRQVMAGLAQYVQPEQLAGRLVCVVANLKPAKLAGEPSEAMVLAADTPTPDGGQLVRVLLPPDGAAPGDLVHLDGVSPPAAFPKVLKSEDWRKVAPGLVVAGGGRATFEGTPLVTLAGLVTLPPEIPDGSEIH